MSIYTEYFTFETSTLEIARTLIISKREEIKKIYTHRDLYTIEWVIFDILINAQKIVESKKVGV